MRVVKPIDLRTNQKAILDIAYSGEILLVARPAKRNVVIMSENEFNKRERALRNAEYLAKLDQSIEDVRENGAYEYLGNGQFSDTPTKVNI